MSNAMSPAIRSISAGAVNALMLLMLSVLTMVFGLFWLLVDSVTLCHEGFGALSVGAVHANDAAARQRGGGLLNAIVGSLLMAASATLIGTPIGILAGIYLAEYGERSWLAPVTRFINDILLSAPSIVIGLFIYAIYVAQRQAFFRLGRHFRALADRDSGRRAHDRQHAEAGARQFARGGCRARRAALENDR